MNKSTNDRLVWQAGELKSTDRAQINILSPTSQYGLNVFESVRFYRGLNGSLLGFKIKEHLQRLAQSLKIIGLESDYSDASISAAIHDSIVANDFTEDTSVRIVMYVEETGSWSYTGKCELLVAPMTMGRAFNEGVTCCISSWERISDNSLPPRVKAGANYINGRMAQLEALRNDYQIPIMLNNRGTVAEAPGACIFIVRDNTLITPPTTSSILESITRSTVIQIAEKLDLKVKEDEIDRTELYVSDEIFLCGTAMEITPVFSVDRVPIHEERIGPLTESLTSTFFQIARGGGDPSTSMWTTDLNTLAR